MCTFTEHLDLHTAMARSGQIYVIVLAYNSRSRHMLYGYRTCFVYLCYEGKKNKTYRSTIILQHGTHASHLFSYLFCLGKKVLFYFSLNGSGIRDADHRTYTKPMSIGSPMFFLEQIERPDQKAS